MFNLIELFSVDLHHAKANAYVNEKSHFWPHQKVGNYCSFQKRAWRKKWWSQARWKEGNGSWMCHQLIWSKKVLFLTFKDFVGDRSLCMLECRELINAVYLGFGWHQSLKLWSHNLQIIGTALLTSGKSSKS